MSSYISSNANRFYVAVEPAYGRAASIAAANRFPAVRLHAHQNLQIGRRLDKTGTRTFTGASSSSRRQTAFEAQTYLTSWTGSGQPGYGPLFQAALGAPVQVATGLTIASLQGPLQMQTSTPHGLAPGSAVCYENEIRFVASLIDVQSFVINAPFSSLLQPGSLLAPALTYAPATAPPSLSIYDYWDPITAVSRLVVGACVDVMTISLNGDFHEFAFSGPAADLLDSSSFVSGAGGLSSYPSEPALSAFDYSIVPGHLGEVWLGGPANQFFTLTAAMVEIRNNIEMRNLEFGSSYPRALAAGHREVVSKLSLLAQDDAQTLALYAAAKQRMPMPVMLQLGQQQGQLMAVYLPKMVPEIPIYDDSESRLQWEFQNNVAQGVADDEIFVAFA